MNKREPKVVTLKYPISFGEETITELRFRPAKARDMRTFPGDPTMNDLLNYAGRLCGQPRAVIDEIDVAEDLGAVLEVVKGFLPSTPETGIER